MPFDENESTESDKSAIDQYDTDDYLSANSETSRNGPKTVALFSPNLDESYKLKQSIRMRHDITSSIAENTLSRCKNETKAESEHQNLGSDEEFDCVESFGPIINAIFSPMLKQSCITEKKIQCLDSSSSKKMSDLCTNYKQNRKWVNYLIDTDSEEETDACEKSKHCNEEELLQRKNLHEKCRELVSENHGCSISQCDDFEWIEKHKRTEKNDVEVQCDERHFEVYGQYQVKENCEKYEMQTQEFFDCSETKGFYAEGIDTENSSCESFFEDSPESHCPKNVNKDLLSSLDTNILSFEAWKGLLE